MSIEANEALVRRYFEIFSARGEPYENRYRSALRLCADGITAVREYVDTLYAMRMLAPAR